ncbi:G2 M phase-specific E3 ubiquitin-protein ligase-like [Solea senegalensis]|uniref:G2 M phase-specific E3 ubiquitin-protein ligase-like n=1 Tax=Solea senegalensis TaxID=28829 RepID=A0AAV6RRS2_SOLSE|nr:G2 M phase-specific E3 ubiquitin-protein ligase-like [Solea senegalensis]
MSTNASVSVFSLYLPFVVVTLSNRYKSTRCTLTLNNIYTELSMWRNEVLLQRITWPREDDNDDDDCSVETKRHISSFLRQFIADGRFTETVETTPTELTDLVKFWTGWEVLPWSLCVDVVEGRYPTAATYFETLNIPGHYKDYTSFKGDILACICTCQRVIVPTVATNIKVMVQACEEHEVAAEEVGITGNAEKVVENIIVDARYSCPHVSP